MQRRTVQSSALSSVGYDPDARILELEFRENGGVWQYFDFPLSAYNRFINSDSLGHFFVTRIKGKYSELKVRYAHH
ncbi:KTSC domain-containing protein [Mucilaginibacter sp. cycad4]|uniref:KTSC domain-containing protein n=1 Tax=Mucilaginibacter sp. cycad4 TaxID=3342096 RepID=UPI002AAC02CF|nr:KTSC domain-containing protein [Mucilaginibacter gossypii]WPU98076.1 KTSC domain-containing protein [Mucilaginibacter gossypii]